MLKGFKITIKPKDIEKNKKPEKVKKTNNLNKFPSTAEILEVKNLKKIKTAPTFDLINMANNKAKIHYFSKPTSVNKQITPEESKNSGNK